MATNVKITCKYYQVREFRDNDITENTYDLIPWLNRLNSMSLENKYKDVNGISGRLEDIVRIGETNIYALNFMRMDDVSTTYKVKKNCPAEHVDIDVEVGEYIAKNTVCLYDSENQIMMIQGNRGGYADSSIESYINDFFETKVCEMTPITENIDFLGENTEYMKLDVRLANIREFRPQNGSIFERIIYGMNQIEGVNAHVEISLGRNKTSRLNRDQMHSVISDLRNNRECVSSAKVKLQDDQITGLYDLFDNLCKDEITITINAEDKGCIKFEKLSKKMNDVYSFNGAKNRVLNAIEA
ncbi:MAG: DUF6731 family protein [Agathobacter sp.]